MTKAEIMQYLKSARFQCNDFRHQTKIDEKTLVTVEQMLNELKEIAYEEVKVPAGELTYEAFKVRQAFGLRKLREKYKEVKGNESWWVKPRYVLQPHTSLIDHPEGRTYVTSIDLEGHEDPPETLDFDGKIYSIDLKTIERHQEFPYCFIPYVYFRRRLKDIESK